MGSSTKIYNDCEEKSKNIPKHNNNALYSSNSDFSITSTKTFNSISTPNNSERKNLNTVSSGATSSNSKEIE